MVRLGEFHTCMSLLGVLGKGFMEYWLSDVLIEAEVIAQGSILSVIKGRQYNRSVCCLKLASEALRRLQLQDFLANICENENVKVMELSQSLRKFIQEEALVKQLTAEFADFAISFVSYMKENVSAFPPMPFDSPVWTWRIFSWALFERHLRETDKCILQAFPKWTHGIFRVIIRITLDTCLSTCMKCPILSHPYVVVHLSDNFAVQQQRVKGFSQTIMDRTIEQTCHRDTKAKGRLTGFSRKAATLTHILLLVQWKVLKM